MSPSPRPPPPPRLLFLGLALFSCAVMSIGTWLMMRSGGPLPPPRDPPPPPEQDAVLSHRYKESFYRSLVEEDARRAGLQGFDFRALGKRQAIEITDLAPPVELKPGSAWKTGQLELRALVKKIWVGEEGRGYRTEHLLLAITNLREQHLAYRIETAVAGEGCAGKGLSSHNAIALRPLETLHRTECLAQDAKALVIRRVEVLELSPLGYRYVSKLDPGRIGHDARTSEGHRPPPQSEPCRHLPWREINAALTRSGARWFDVIDFYSRHNCDEYSFFPTYRWLKSGPERLPALPPAGGTAGGAR